MKITQILKSAVLGLGLIAAAPAFADGDSSADAAPGFRDASTSAGVIIRVPIDEQGRELTDAAEMRVHGGADLDNQSVDLKAAFETATVIPSDAVAHDTSTSHNGGGGNNSCNYGWNSWYGNSGWQPSYYYSTYTPTYNYYGNSYSYNQPSYYNYYTNYDSCNYYGYRYYYYHHGW